VSAAEHAVALLLATARNVAVADHTLKGGQWQRSQHTGIELHGKVVGIVGLGRIGVLVAARLAGFGVELIAYDPYIPAARAAQLGVRLVPLDELLRGSDFISIHLPKTAETVGLIGEEQLRLVKPTVRIVNAARGGIVDEHALYQALKDGRWLAPASTCSPPNRAPTRAVRVRQRGGDPHLGKRQRRRRRPERRWRGRARAGR
jgi:D-3-phosphoglycerate dehydrogenase